MVKIKSFVFNPFMENTYVVYDNTKECVIIDPGCYEKYEQQELVHFIEENNLTVIKLLNTHCHIDHVLGNKFVKDKFKAQLYLHKLDEATLRAVTAYAPSYGFANYAETSADLFIDEGDEVTFGNTSFDVVFVPGHAPGHIAFIHHDSKSIIGGDVLFDGSIGRTDLPGGDFDILIESIHSKFFTQPDDYTVYSGHGATTTIGKEKISNPFCAVS